MFDPWVWKIPWRREWLPLLGESHRQRSLVGYSYSPWGRKESEVTEQLILALVAHQPAGGTPDINTRRDFRRLTSLHPSLCRQGYWRRGIKWLDKEMWLVIIRAGVRSQEWPWVAQPPSQSFCPSFGSSLSLFTHNQFVNHSGFLFGEGNGNPLQYSCLGNPTDRGAWQATVPGVTKSRHDSFHSLGGLSPVISPRCPYKLTSIKQSFTWGGLLCFFKGNGKQKNCFVLPVFSQAISSLLLTGIHLPHRKDGKHNIFGTDNGKPIG